MAYSAPHSPARHRDSDADSNGSASRPSPNKLLRLLELSAERASSLPPRRLSSPVKNAPQVRPRLNQFYTFDHAVQLFKRSKNIIVLTGAGISTSLGVPDFRSANGVYNLMVDSKYDDPQELFHIDNFRTDPGEFFKQAAKVFPRMQGLVPADGAGKEGISPDVPLIPRYSATHAFLALLHAKGKLLTNYTQNIDGLETAAGLSSAKLIQCHGTLSTATCMSCGKRTSARKYMPVVRQGNIPFCKCSLEPDKKVGKQRGRGGKRKRKRDELEDSDSDLEESRRPFPKGLLKPDMTFFGEHISYSYAPRLEVDKAKVDLLVIVGTSLKVAPVNDMLLAVPPTVPQIWISKDRCQREGVKVDIELLGECDLIIGEISRRAGWTAALEERLWTAQKTRDVQVPIVKAKLSQKQAREPNEPSVTAKAPLEIRPKQEQKQSPSKILSSTSGPVIKINDEVVTDFELDAGQEGASDKAKGKAKSVELSLAGAVSTVAEPETDDKAFERPKKPQLPPSKVSIELELGQRSRWFIRRAK
ncbi:NAD-dependent histone deacetylase sir2 [Exophiala xenobiotica]|nr:NAD-dependent histone deacetylase sir2 [Exophiala xenobiotica]KAK5482921.1 NAD-dependent histone deacetylase sir2 [Exophiala xenobiotica]